jgi:hypothetical protein
MNLKKLTLESITQNIEDLMKINQKGDQTLKLNVLKLLRQSIKQAKAENNPERIHKIIVIKRETKKIEGDMYCEIEEENLFEDTLEQIKTLEEYLKD